MTVDDSRGHGMSSGAITLAYLGLDECGSLSDATPWFALAGVLTRQPEGVRHLIRRAVIHTGKHLKRIRKASGEYKWGNASRRLRLDVLARLARAEVEVYTLIVAKGGRRIEDTPENYAVLVCVLLRACWARHPNVALAWTVISPRRSRLRWSTRGCIAAGRHRACCPSAMSTASAAHWCNWRAVCMRNARLAMWPVS